MRDLLTIILIGLIAVMGIPFFISFIAAIFIQIQEFLTKNK
jgi:hypothetical protein